MFIKINSFDLKKVSIPFEKMATVSEKAILADAIRNMQTCGFGICCILDSSNELKGVLTDGDIRRLILNFQGPLSSLMVRDVMDFATKKPVSFKLNDDLLDSLNILQERRIWDAPILENNKVVGLVHLHYVFGQLIKSLQ